VLSHTGNHTFTQRSKVKGQRFFFNIILKTLSQTQRIDYQLSYNFKLFNLTLCKHTLRYLIDGWMAG